MDALELIALISANVGPLKERHESVDVFLNIGTLFRLLFLVCVGSYSWIPDSLISKLSFFLTVTPTVRRLRPAA